ncbi:MAG TPA: hypothetical protein DCG12_18530 [Planctomycetaceae bacterium]|nr:hypothetical protein [Planctomycetaceae bacterium]
MNSPNRKPQTAIATILFVLLLTPMAFGQQTNGSGSAPPAEMPSLWNLAIQGGWFMIPIGIASIVTVAFTLERLNGLRRGRILPPALIDQLRLLMGKGAPDPNALWDAARSYPSPTAALVRAAVLKIGRPQPEVEAAVMDAVERETGEMTRNLRPINVVASIAPLLGLLGTVQGMIMAFMVTSTTTSTGSAKAQELAYGIYTALVTTFAGLSVAVVSVVLANFLEGRIEKLLRQLEAIFLDLLPRLEEYEGRMRVAQKTGDPDSISVRKVSGSAPRKGSEAGRRAESGGSRQLGTPRKMVRRPAPEKTDPASEESAKIAEPDSEKPAAHVETLRGNFDR